MMPIYLDHAASTPLSDATKAYLTPLLDLYGNPSSSHSAGTPVRQLIEDARQSVSDFIRARPEEILFTPSGCAGNTLAVKGLTSDDPQKNQYHVFYSPTAHKSMRAACESCLLHTPLKVHADGSIDLSALDALLTQSGTLRPLVCIEAANSEIGTIQDVQAAGSVTHRHGGILVVDATGYIPSLPVRMDLWKNDVDILTFSGHKLHALKGVGVFWKRREIKLNPLIYGSQEQGLIGGTESVLSIASLGKSVSEYDYTAVSSDNRNFVYDHITGMIPDCYVIGAPVKSDRRLPQNLYLCFPGIDGESLMILLDMNGIQVSTGSACNSKTLSASAVLSAIGLNQKDLRSCIRMTFSGQETRQQLDYVCRTMKQCVAVLRKCGAE